MEREEYFDMMRETAGLVNPAILEFLEPLKRENENLYEIIMKLPRKRVLSRGDTLNKPMIRPSYVRLSYEACGGKDWREIIPACVSMELLNISTYVANKVFDHKGGERNEAEINNEFIASLVLRDCASRAMSGIYHLVDRETYASIQDRIAEIDTVINIGQYIDMNELRIGDLDSFESEECYLRKYEKKCYGFCGHFYGNLGVIGSKLSGNNSRENEDALFNFGRLFGSALQVVNDIGDYVPPESGAYDVEKHYQDQYSDFRNGRLTLPLYNALMVSDAVRKRVKEIFYNGDFSRENLRWMSDIIYSSGAFRQSKLYSKRLSNEAKRYLDVLPESRARDMLSVMVSQVRTNKYFAAFRELYGK